MKQGKKGHTVHVASLMDLCHFKNSELDPQFEKYKRSSQIPRLRKMIRDRMLCIY